jgi:hypothetical protein
MRFLDYTGHRQNGIIWPRCGSHPRHRALWTYLADQLAGLESRIAILYLSAEQNLPANSARWTSGRVIGGCMDATLQSACGHRDWKIARYRPLNWRAPSLRTDGGCNLHRFASLRPCVI